MKTSSITTLTSEFMVFVNEQRYQRSILTYYKTTIEHLCIYASQRNVEKYSESFGCLFLREQYSIRLEELGRNGQRTPNPILARLRTIKMLNDFFCNRPIQRMYIMDRVPLLPAHQSLHERYISELSYNGYAKGSIVRFERASYVFLRFFELRNFCIASLDKEIVNEYIQYASALISRKTTHNYLHFARRFLKFCHSNHYTQIDFSLQIPSIRLYRHATIPSVWKPEDVTKLINAIDRSGPTGRRDFAIFQLIIKMGLRTSDIRNIRLKDFDWKQNTISLCQAKTGRRITLPLLPDVGWAVIDYLKHGRPLTEFDHVFVRHNAPFEPFTLNNGLNHILFGYAQKAGIKLCKEKKHGMHSLRHTLASQLLAAETPVPIISEILGHSNSLSTSVYLKVGLSQLSECPLSLSEVIND